jgi:ribosomal protein S13
MTKRAKESFELKMGRPPTDAHLQRRNRVVTLVTDEDLVRLQREAAKRHMSLSAVVYEVLRHNLISPRSGQRPRSTRKELE